MSSPEAGFVISSARSEPGEASRASDALAASRAGGRPSARGAGRACAWGATTAAARGAGGGAALGRARDGDEPIGAASAFDGRTALGSEGGARFVEAVGAATLRGVARGLG